MAWGSIVDDIILHHPISPNIYYTTIFCMVFFVCFVVESHAGFISSTVLGFMINHRRREAVSSELTPPSSNNTRALISDKTQSTYDIEDI